MFQTRSRHPANRRKRRSQGLKALVWALAFVVKQFFSDLDRRAGLFAMKIGLCAPRDGEGRCRLSV
ncbi:MAG: hypothetical protein RLZZ444_678 [Pseudomonadota bacterium]|jgi:hypothetical protein